MRSGGQKCRMGGGWCGWGMSRISQWDNRHRALIVVDWDGERMGQADYPSFRVTLSLGPSFRHLSSGVCDR